jgi:alpha-glucosidase
MILDFVFHEQRREKKARSLERDYRSFFHNTDGKRYCHFDVHNLYGYMMTKASSEGLARLLPHRFLLFSRSSYIGAGRYGGLWTGDNSSKWEHLLLNLRHMAGLNMCGFLYNGADTGGFMGECDRELMLRWLAVAIFTPLLRNHNGSRAQGQECYAFGDTGDFRSILKLRYRLIPYLYSEYMKAALRSDMFIQPLGFAFPEDQRAREIEDQLLVGGSIMMTPIIEQGAESRKVWLPEDMIQVFYNGETFTCTPLPRGEHTIKAGLGEVVFFIRKGKLLPIGKAVTNTRELDFNDLTLLGDGNAYELYADDGMTRDYSPENIRILKK